MWQYKGVTIRKGRTWLSDDGKGRIIQQSPQWNIWSSDEKEAAGLVEIIPEAAPDDRFYRWTRNPDGVMLSAPKQQRWKRQSTAPQIQTPLLRCF